MTEIIKVFLAALGVLFIMGVLVDHSNKVAAQDKVAMCRITDMNKVKHDMPCEIVDEYLSEVKP